MRISAFYFMLLVILAPCASAQGAQLISNHPSAIQNMPGMQASDQQDHQPAESEPGANTSNQSGSMSGMHMEERAGSSASPQAGSGTSWEPASVPEHEWMVMRGGWEVMAHGVIFADYNQQGGPRGEGKAESVNWGMLMEQHRLGRGTILLR
jgi:hypothetical protein